MFDLSIAYISAIVLGLCLIYSSFKVIYNLYFHPLASFPGPKLAAISNVYFSIYILSGHWPLHLEDLHNKYGDVVRFAPNDLDFASPQSLQTIYGTAKQGKEAFVKGEIYNDGPESEKSIGRSRDPEQHKQLRQYMAPAFSTKSLRTQADVILLHVETFISQLKRFGNVASGVDVSEWYNWITFDIIGDLAFGQSFGAIQQVETHPWVKAIQSSIQCSLYTEVFKRLPLLGHLLLFWKPASLKHLQAQRQATYRYSKERIVERIAKGNNRNDFLAHLLSEKATDVTQGFLMSQANALIGAGSETTSTFLFGTSYHLLKNPTTLQRLAEEVRTAFSTGEAINPETTTSLLYLNAVIEEGLRIFPPVATGLQRVSPGAIIDGHYVPKGVNISAGFWTITHNERYFHNANQFHPERYLPDEHPFFDAAYKMDNKEASKPFLMGPRGCIGTNLAYMEMRTILARLIWEFDLELMSEGIDWNRDTKFFGLVWSKRELRVRFTPRA